MTAQFLHGAPILVGADWRLGHGVLIEHGAIVAILPESDRVAAERLHLPPESRLAPGLIDIQVNGGGGVLFNDDPTQEAAIAIAAAHRSLGTTAILPTLITDTPERMRQAALSIRAAPGVLGLHFEGPFLSPARAGVHRAALIRAPEAGDLALLEALAANPALRILLTLAPETVPEAILLRLAGAGVILAAGHSAASFEQVQAAIEAGVTGFTHVFNAMSPLSARAPGIAAAALLDAATWCGVIADGIHVHPAMLRLLRACKPADRILLVSDAMPPTGTAMQEFRLQGRTIRRSFGRLVTEDGVLAGADICLADAVRAAIRLLDISPALALGMASAAPAAFLKLDHRIGRIAAGMRADLLLLAEDMSVLGTWLGGAWQGQPGVLPARQAA